MDDAADVTMVLERARAGEAGARNQLMRLIYGELRQVAAGLMAGERPGHSLQPTALVHEAVLRLIGEEALTRAPNRRYVFAAAARAMRQILVDHARRRDAAKRGGGREEVPLDSVLERFDRRAIDLVALDDALERLAALSPRQSQVVTLRFFGGYSVPEVAKLLDVSPSTVESDFRLARAWLRRQLAGEVP
jgi:RNA polymerase sigma factor (TIGR02999 family)